MRFREIFVLVGLFVLAFSACTTAPIKEFPRVKLGMEKGQVIEIVGSPRRTDRRLSADIWTYRFYENEKPIEKMVIFKEGKVQYCGDPLSEEMLINNGSPDNREPSSFNETPEEAYAPLEEPAIE